MKTTTNRIGDKMENEKNIKMTIKLQKLQVTTIDNPKQCENDTSYKQVNRKNDKGTRAPGVSKRQQINDRKHKLQVYIDCAKGE